MAAAAAAPAAAAADRGAYYAKTGSGGGGGRDHQDLLDADKNGVDIGTIPDAELPDDLRGLTVDAKKEKIAEAARQRSQAAGELAVLAAKRDAYLESERARSPAKEGGFDDSVKKSVEKLVKKPAK